MLYMIPTVVGAALPLITLPIFTRILTTSDYGVIAVAAAFAAFLSGLANLGLPLTYERNFFQYAERNAGSRLLYSVIGFVTVASLVLGILTWLFREWISLALTGSRAHGAVVLVSYCSISVQSLKLYFLTYLKNEGDAKSFVRFSVDEAVLWTACALVFVMLLRMGPIGLPLGQLVGGVAVTAVLAAKFLRRLPPRVDRALLREAVVMSLPLTPRLFIGLISNNFDKYVIGVLGSMGGVGLYSIGQKISILAFSVMSALQNVFAPGVYRRMFEGGEAARGIGRYLTPFAYASAGVALLVALFAEEVLRILTPPEYHGASIIVNVLAVYYAILFFGKQPQLIFAKKAGLISVLSGVSVAVSAAAMVFFVRQWGAVGAAWGTLAAGCATTWLGVTVGQRYFRIHYERTRMTAIFGLLAVAAITSFLAESAGVPYALRLLMKIAWVAGFLGLGYRFGYVNRSVMLEIGGILRRRRGLPARPLPEVPA